MRKIKKALSLIMSAVLMAAPMTVLAEEGTGYLTKPLKLNVAKSGGDFSDIQSALDSISGIPTEKNSVTIMLAKGVYNEAVTVDIPYVTIKNASSANPSDVVITYDKANGHEDLSKNFGTEKSATFTITRNADNFSAENVTFQNSYNLDDPARNQTQAVALVSMADKVVFNHCDFIARQDTLYLKGATNHSEYSARDYLKDCYVEGTVDFIFGDATAYFDNCDLKLAYYTSGGHFTAANTTLFNTGYVFNKCRLTVDEQYTEDYRAKIDLGRPWQGDKDHPVVGSETVYINCVMPELLKESRFSAWNASTQTNKIRYAEYGSKLANGKAADTSKKEDWVRTLTDEQAASYTAYNVLSGKDGWNPSGEKTAEVKVNSVTFDNCEASIPLGEEFKLNATVNPSNAKNKNLVFESSDANIVSVDESGNLKAMGIGKAYVTATAEDGGYKTVCDVSVTAARTPVPTVSAISVNKTDNLSVNTIITGSYSYEIPSDMNIDTAVLRWYAQDPENGSTILLKEGDKKTALTYVTKPEDAGYNIIFAVCPQTQTTYGVFGDEVRSDATAAVSGDTDKVLFRTGFNDLTSWKAENTEGKDPAYIVTDDKGNTLAAAVCDENKNSSSLELKGKTFSNANYEMRARFNPEIAGWNAESYFDIYTNVNKYSYNKVRITRGGNNNSLRVYIYRKNEDNGEEVLLGKDEASLKDKIFQNSGEDNNFFRIKVSVEGENIGFEVYPDNSETAMCKLAVSDVALEKGGFKLDAYGKDKALLLDSLTVTRVDENRDEKVRVYLAGDSTVKSYGDDNTIGGWGEFLPYYFDSNKVEIINKAEGGRSSRSYINQGRLDEILNEIREGDYLFIQFGHNDARTDDAAEVEHKVALGEPDTNGIYPTIPAVKAKTPPRIYEFYKNTEYGYSDTFYPYESGTYKWYLKQYISGARSKGAIPVLITPVSQVKYDEDGKIGNQHGENGGYVIAAKQAAEESGCVCIDMYDITKQMYESYGNLVTQGLQNIKDDGSMDVTHYNKFGSNIVTSYFVKALAEAGLDIADDEIASSRFVSKTEDLKLSTLYVVGSSYGASYNSDPEYVFEPAGYGDYLQKYLSDSITVCNMSLKDATAKNFIKTDNYKKLFDSVSEGDYVLVAFGENDAVRATDDDILYNWSDPAPSRQTKDSFKYYLYEYYVKPILAKKAVPILATPLAEGKISADGFEDENAAYNDAIKEVVTEFGLAWANIDNESQENFVKSGENAMNAIYAVKEDGGIQKDMLNSYGADKLARLMLRMFKASSATIKNYIDDSVYNEGKDAPATRGEFVKLIAEAAGLDGEPLTNFSDVVEGKDYYNAVGIAAINGIIDNDYTKNFEPDRQITKSEAEKIIFSTLNHFGKLSISYKKDTLKMASTLTEEDAYILAEYIYNTVR